MFESPTAHEDGATRGDGANPNTFLSQPLRKSLSVDSFVRRDAEQSTPGPAWASNRNFSASNDSVVDPSINGRWGNNLSGSSSPPRPEVDGELPGVARHRARYPTKSSSYDGYENVAYPDSDVEPAEKHYLPQASINTFASFAQKSNVTRPAELSNNGDWRDHPFASTSDTVTNKRETTHRTRRSTGPSSAQTRLRSGSLGNERLYHGQVEAISSVGPEVVVAVVGTGACGKTNVIRHGLKSFGLSSATTQQVKIGASIIPYAARTAQADANNNTDSFVSVIELDSTFLRLGSSDIRNVWPDNLPEIDGVLVCYDSSNPGSFQDVFTLTKGYHERQIPTIVIACKSDLEKAVDPTMALNSVQSYAGIVEVSTMNDHGRRKMRKCFHWLVGAIRRQKTKSAEGIQTYENPASPNVLANGGPWSRGPSIEKRKSRSSSSASLGMSLGESTSNRQTNSANAPPTANLRSPLSQDQPFVSLHGGQTSQSSFYQSTPISSLPMPTTSTLTGSPRHPPGPTSPIRARSTGDLLLEAQRQRTRERDLDRGGGRPLDTMSVGKPLQDLQSYDSLGSVNDRQMNSAEDLEGAAEEMDDKELTKEKESVHVPWATFEELLDKLFFLAVSSDHPVFISRFLLTYRRFASPRSVLLGMQKRMIELGQPSHDPSLACFAQMKLCSLLDSWMKEYPNDFAVPGTAGALSALVKQIISNTHLLHYGSDFLPFLEQLSTLQDRESSWAMRVDEALNDSDDSDDGGLDDERTNSLVENEDHSSATNLDDDNNTNGAAALPSRAHTSNQPIPPMDLIRSSSLTQAESTSSGAGGHTSLIAMSRTPSRDLLKDLVRVATNVSLFAPVDVASEITRIDLQNFLDIEPRHWLQHVLSREKKDPDVDTIPRFNTFFNHLSNWFTSLILCHDRPRNRARQMEKFANVGEKLRGLNNYSGLRAVVNGISNSTYEGDPALDIFSQKEVYRQYQSWDRLFQSLGSHRAYRMALSNSKGARIPCLEVHLVDLLRAHQANPDRHPDDLTKINWGKYNMMGKFISVTTECQAHCRMADDYDLPSNPDIRKALTCQIMDEDMWPSRMETPDDYIDEPRPTLSTSAISHDQPASSKETALLRKFFFWDK